MGWWTWGRYTPLKRTWLAGKSPFSIENASSNARFSIAMSVFGEVLTVVPRSCYQRLKNSKFVFFFGCCPGHDFGGSGHRIGIPFVSEFPMWGREKKNRPKSREPSQWKHMKANSCPQKQRENLVEWFITAKFPTKVQLQEVTYTSSTDESSNFQLLDISSI